MEDGALQSFDEAIGSRPPWLCACMCNFKVLAGQIEVSLELAASVGEHTFDWPSCFGEGAGEITEEAKFVETLGLRYISIPIISNLIADNITDNQIDQFSETLTSTDHYPMLIQCRSSNRVGGMLLLHQVLEENKDLEESLPEAHRADLKTLLKALTRQRLDR